MDKEWYRMLKARHLCVTCKKQDAYTLGGRANCYECAEKKRLSEQRRRQDPELLRKKSEQEHERRQQLLAQGICTSCARRKVRPGTTKCETCHARQRARHVPKPYDEQMCWTCRKQPHIEGHKMCQRCYDRAKAHILSVRGPGFGQIVLPGSIRAGG